jgi:hypothetical protein
MIGKGMATKRSPPGWVEPKTIETYQHIKQKLNLKNATELTRNACNGS